MTPPVGTPHVRPALLACQDSRVSHHEAAPPSTAPPTVIDSHALVLSGVAFWKMSGLPAAAPTSAPPPAPTSTSSTRDGDTVTAVASSPPPTSPTIVPTPIPSYGV